jgi:hypothetical protein
MNHLLHSIYCTLHHLKIQVQQLSPYGSTPNGSCSRDVGVWPDGELWTTAVGDVNAVDALGSGANDGTSAENPPSGEEKFDLV